MAHIPVLLKETIERLSLKPGLTVFDGTIGGAGHAAEICRGIAPEGTLIGMDRDENALRRAKTLLADCGCRVLLREGNFREIDATLDAFGIRHIDRALFDLGISSDQLESSGRGFSFLRDEPLMMTFSATPRDDEITAWEIVNRWEEKHIADILYGYGDERFARRVAKAIVKVRESGEIKTSRELAEIVAKSVPRYAKRGKIHPATKTFQAIRIAVNDEIRSTEEGITKALSYLSDFGRIAVITFHSTEDRLVKRLFKQFEKDGIGKIVTKKPIAPTESEVKKNPRARSAHLRIFEKTQHLQQQK